MANDVANLRVHFYGTQGSASTFPEMPELDAYHTEREQALLRKIWRDMGRFVGEDGQLHATPESIFGGTLDHGTLISYLKRLDVARPRVYGGWTTCVRVETADGDDIVLDAGSGFRNCAKALQRKWGDRPQRELHLLGSHSHLDHTEGFDQSAVCFDARNTIQVYGNRQFLYALDSNLGIFSRYVREDLRGVHTPITFELMPARFRGIELRDDAGATREIDHPWESRPANETIRIGHTTIEAFPVYHPAPCLAYRIRRGDSTFVYCTDHELRHGQDRGHPRQMASEEAEQRVHEYARGADLLYRDAQYLRVEYEGLRGVGASGATSRLDWGHSCIEDVLQMAERSSVRRLLLGHHDPERGWSERYDMDRHLRSLYEGRELEVELACAGTVIDI